MIINTASMQILVVEDNHGDFFLIEEFLIDAIANVHIDHATRFSEAEKLLRSGKKYEAVLLDLSLSDCSGDELVKNVVSLAHSAAVIVLTGFSDKEFGVKTLSMGISDYLLKDELSAPQLYKSIHYSLERIKINFQLKDSEEKYRHLFNFSPLPMWVYEVQSLKFLSVNDSAIRHYGFTRDEFLNMTLKDIRPEEGIPELEAAVSQNRFPETFNKGIYQHKKKNGEVFDVEIQSNIITFEGKKCRLVLATDVSDRMSYIRAIEEQNHVMKEIAWIQSHVVRAPLARIMGLINILNSDTAQDDKSELINFILHSAQELDTIVRDIVRKTEIVEGKIR